MNFETLKTGFLSYLQEKIINEETTDKNIQNSSLSIFMYSSEFKDYLVEEVGADTSIFSKSIDEIMSMEFVNGKLVENTNNDSFEKEDESSNLMTQALNDIFADETVISTLDTDGSTDLSIDEMSAFVSSVAQADENGQVTFDNIAKSVQSIQEGTYEPTTIAESGNNIINRLLGSVYDNKTVIKTLDEDGDGILSDAEKAKFEEFITGYDGSSDELTEADIKRAFDDIMDGTFSYDADLSKKADEIDKETELELEEKEDIKSQLPTGQSSGVSSSGGYYGGGSVGSSNSFSSSNANQPKTIENMTLEELESEKSQRESDVTEAQEGVNAVYSGENEAVKNANEDYETAKEDYDEAVNNDEKISDELKEQRETNLEDIETKEKAIDDQNIKINDQEALISDQKSTIDADKSNLSALESALSALPASSDDPEEQSEIDSKRNELNSAISEARQKLEEDEAKLTELEEELDTLKEDLETLEGELEELEQTRTDIEAEILANCSEETKKALEKFNEAKDNVAQVKEAELKTAQNTLADAKTALDEINAKINEKKAQKTEKEYSISEFDFDFDLNLSGVQEQELAAFKENWEKNHDKYEAVEEATGMPAELVAAIHWREGSGNFNTYLHNGQELGKTTTIVPRGICFNDWTTAAIDAVTNYGGGLSTIDPDNIETYYDYAEKYNGLGYRNKGLPSPYVWAGTSNYSSGKYVADGQFDPNHVDQQLGVAVMLQALLS